MSNWSSSIDSLLDKIRLNCIQLTNRHIKNHLYYKNNTKMNHRATFFYLINIYDEFISIDLIDTYLSTISFLSFQQEEE